MQSFNLPNRTLHTSKIKTLPFLIGTLVFTVIGIYMILDEAEMGWFVAISFGIGSTIFAVNMLPQASYLNLDEKGFEMSSLFKKSRYEWDEINHFSHGSFNGNKMVTFYFAKEFQRAKKLRKLASIMGGAEGALHDTFGLKAEELAELMNAYKAESKRVKNKST